MIANVLTDCESLKGKPFAGVLETNEIHNLWPNR